MKFTEGLFNLKKSPTLKYWRRKNDRNDTDCGCGICSNRNLLSRHINSFVFASKKSQVKHIWIGQYIGTVIVIGASLLVAQGVVNLIPQQWVIGLLGLLPLYLGVKIWIKGEEDQDESSILSLFSSGKFNQLFLTMTFIVLASSADDFSIYIP